MVKRGYWYECDRCGKTDFVEDETIRIKGYVRKSDKDLCPTCTELYNKMMNNFFAPEVKRPINLED